jgi:hypothetical protein
VVLYGLGSGKEIPIAGPVRAMYSPDTMDVTQQLHDLGQSLWLNNITRNLP